MNLRREPSIASEKLEVQKNIGMTLRCCIRMNLRREPSIASEKLGGQKIYRHDVEFLHPCEFAAEHVIANREERSGKQSQLLNKYLIE